MNHGAEFEKAIHELCEQYFFPDVVFRNPFYLKGGRIKRELADIVIPLSNSILAFQVRSVLDERETGVSLHRYFRKVMHAVGQFKLLGEMVREKKVLTARSSRGMDVPLSFDGMREVVGILVVNQPLAKLRKLDQQLARGFIESKGIPLHIFSRKEFELVVKHRNTLPDLLGYLRVRRRILGHGKIIGYQGELSLLWIHINRPKLVEEACKNSFPILAAVPHMSLPEPRSRRAVTLRKRRDLGGQLMDWVISNVHDIVVQESSPPPPAWARDVGSAGDVKSYWMLLQELSSLDRRSREALGEKFIEKMMRADKVGFGYSLVIPTFHPLIEGKERGCLMLGQAAVVVFSSNQERKERLDSLRGLCVVALQGYGLSQIIGITTDPWAIEPRYLDFVFQKPEKPKIFPDAAEIVKNVFGGGFMEGQILEGMTLGDLQKAYSRLKIWSPE
jgi:hypothetical protein